MADDITSSFSGSPLLWWDTHEPLLRPWSTADLTAAAKAGMPRSPVLLGAGYACWVSTRVERTQAGLLEHTHAVVALDSESAEPQVHETVMTGLRRLSTRHTLASATATLADLDDGGLRAHIRLPGVPVAIGLGAKAVTKVAASAADEVFLRWFRNTDNYEAQDPGRNRAHLDE